MISSIILLLIALTMCSGILLMNWFMPYVTPKSIQFGVKIPRERESDPTLERIRTKFHTRLLLGSLLIFIFLIVVPYAFSYYALSLLSIVAEMPFAYLNYYFAFRELNHIKEREGWYRGEIQNVYAMYDDEPIIRKSLAGIYFILPALLLIAIALYLGIVDFGSLPNLLPSSFGLTGTSIHFVPKTILNVFSATFIQITYFVELFVLGQVFIRTRQEIDSSRPVISFWQQEKFKFVYRDLLYLLASMIGITLLFTSLLRWELLIIRFSVLFLLLPEVIGLVLFLTITMMVGQMGSKLFRHSATVENTGMSNVDDDAEWKGGIIDYNKDQQSIFVGRRFGIGWTLNFANPRSWIVLIALFSPALLNIALYALR